MRYVVYILLSDREGDEGGDVGHVTELPPGPVLDAHTGEAV